MSHNVKVNKEDLKIMSLKLVNLKSNEYICENYAIFKWQICKRTNILISKGNGQFFFKENLNIHIAKVFKKGIKLIR